MLFDRFAIESTLRLLGVVFTFLIGILVYLLYGHVWSALFCTMLSGLQLYELIRFQQMISIELDHFMAKLKAGAHGGATQQFLLRKYFPNLSATLSNIDKQFRERESSLVADIQYLEAIINFLPVPILIANEAGDLIYSSQLFRKLFSPQQIHKLSELESKISSLPTNHQQTCEGAIDVHGNNKRFLINRSDILVRGKIRQAYVFLDIDQTLNTGELHAWNKLIRVLTHEMMNSLTPISSLADAAFSRVDRNSNLDKDVKEALQTLSRRSRSLMDFVKGYHQMLKLPHPNRQPFPVNDLIITVQNLFQQENIRFSCECQIQQGYGDVGLIEQALINLVRNSIDALHETADKQIHLRATLNREGKLQFDVEDNGPGMPKEVLENAMVPFYTSKSDGSGIGLSLSRQIAVAHHGSLSITSQEGIGTTIKLVV